MIRFGLAQLDIVWEDIEANKKKVESFLQEGKEKGIQWIVFPEMTMTGFSMNTAMAVYYDEICDFFRQKAKEYGIAIVYGIIAEGKEGKFENHLIMVDENGNKMMEYAKIHPFSYGLESKYYVGGDQVHVCSWKGTSMSGFVCYDLRFPTIFQTVSEESKIIFVIANWPDSRVDHWDVLLRARAIENSCYVIGVNRAGRAGKLNYNGHSAIYNYKGECISEIIEEEGLIVAEVDEDQVDPYRDFFPAVKDRRPDLYKRLTITNG